MTDADAAAGAAIAAIATLATKVVLGDPYIGLLSVVAVTATHALYERFGTSDNSEVSQ